MIEGLMAHGIIVVVDDDEAVRQSTSQIMLRSGYHIRTYESGDDFLAAGNADEAVSCVLLDLHMPGKDGLAVLVELRDRGGSPPVIVVTAHGELSVAIEAMKLGARDFIEKPYEATELMAAIAAAMDSPQVRDESAFRAEAVSLVDTLTPRQLQVLLGVLKGLQNKIIAYELGLSVRTIETYRAQLMEKLHVRGTAEAVRLALAAGLTDAGFSGRSGVENKVAGAA